MSFSTVQLGRLLLTELPQNPAVDQSSVPTLSYSGRLLHVVGQEAYPLSTSAQMAALHDDLQGMVGGQYLIPVVFGDKSDRNGYYSVYGAQDTLQNWNGEVITNDWQVDLQRVGADLEVDFESRLTGPSTVNTTLALTGSQWNSPPGGHYAFYGLGTPTVPSVNRPCSDGTNQRVWVPGNLGSTPPTTARWGCAVGKYGNGRCRFLDSSGLERSGINFAVSSVTSWTLTNGVTQVTPGTGGNILDVNVWTGGAWRVKHWDINYGGSLIGAPWSSVNVLRNDYETVIVRLVADSGGTRVLVDLTLRRGSRFIEFYVNAAASNTIQIVRHDSEAGTVGSGSSAGTVTATTTDSDGNMFTIGSAHTATASTNPAGLSVTAATMDAYVGSVAGGAGANALDTASALMAQYLGRRGETVYAVRR
jgi:hypothetical protein